MPDAADYATVADHPLNEIPQAVLDVARREVATSDEVHPGMVNPLADAVVAALVEAGVIVRGLSFSCDRCGEPLDRPGALAFSDPLPHIDGAKVLAVAKHHICAGCYAALAKADFMPTMSGYDIEEALLAGKQVEFWFPETWDDERQKGRWVSMEGVMLTTDPSNWVMAMLKAGHRGLAYVARVVEA